MGSAKQSQKETSGLLSMQKRNRHLNLQQSIILDYFELLLLQKHLDVARFFLQNAKTKTSESRLRIIQLQVSLGVFQAEEKTSHHISALLNLRG